MSVRMCECMKEMGNVAVIVVNKVIKIAIVTDAYEQIPIKARNANTM